jgi:hypothetical protein
MLKIKSFCMLALVIIFSPQISAQEDQAHCFFVCTPEIKIEPTLTYEPIFRSPTIAKLEDGAVVSKKTIKTEAVFEIVFAVGIPTEIPRIGFTAEAIFIPYEDTGLNPFTGTRANEVEFELEINFDLLGSEHTGGWIESHIDIVDKISVDDRVSGDTDSYTHKLNFELDTTFLVFKWLPESNWLHNVGIEGSLDYVATGLPKAGDVVRGDLFLSDESPWSFSVVLVLPSLVL